MKQVYKITYPTGKIYIGKDSYGSRRYFGSPDMQVVNEDFAQLPEAVRRDYTMPAPRPNSHPMGTAGERQRPSLKRIGSGYLQSL